MMELDSNKDFSVEPMNGGGYIIRQYTTNSDRGRENYIRAFTSTGDLLNFLGLALQPGQPE